MAGRELAGRLPRWPVGARARPAPLPPGLASGVATSAAVAAVATVISRSLAAAGVPALSPFFLAIVGGFAVGRGCTASTRVRLDPGLHFMSGSVLQTAIVLLGLRFGLQDLVTVGGDAVLIVTAVVAAGLVVSWTTARALRVDPTTGLLIGVGTAICGNSAIAAAAPVLRARGDAVSLASVVITAFGTASMLLLPALGRVLGLTERQFGTLAGAGVHDAGQAIAAGFLYGVEAGGIATLVKLARTMFLVPVVVALGWLVTGSRDRRPAAASSHRFAVGFVAAALLRSAGDRWFGDGAWWELGLSVAELSAAVLLTAAMAAMGLRTRLGELRAVGGGAVVVGVASAVACAAVALAGVLLTS